MLGFAHRLVDGVGAGVSNGAIARKAPDLSKPAHLLRKPSLQAGTKLFIFLPDLCQPTDEEEMPLSDEPDSAAGYLEVSIVSMLPSLPPPSNASPGIPVRHFHSSIQQAFPRDFNILLRRSSSDRCAIIQISPEVPLVAVCLLTIPFYISQH